MGRYLRGQPTYEGAHSIFLRTKNLRDGLRFGIQGSGTLNFDLSGEPFPVTVDFDTRDRSNPFIRLAHKRRAHPALEERYEVRLVTTPQPFGGFRWWFACPHTSKKAVCLILPNGGHRFLSRNVYSLAYASQRKGPAGRAQQQGMRVYALLGGTGHWMDGPPPKPKGMRWDTYSREATRLVGYIEAYNKAWLPSMERWLDRLKKRSK